jgi:hypothetical protein
MVPRSIAEEIDPLLSRVWRLIFGLIDVVGVEVKAPLEDEPDQPAA